jgi:hypothetical protein
MKCTMTVGKRRVRTGTLAASFKQIASHDPPRAELNLFTTDYDDSMGGITLNCLDLGSVPTLESLFGRLFSFGRGDPTSDTELGESVCFAPGEQTLEIKFLALQFGHPVGNQLPVEISATCFLPPDDTDVQVHVKGALQISYSEDDA